jgi:acetate---CoA ligase (ADP-forming)
VTIDAACTPTVPRLPGLAACFSPRTVAVVGAGRAGGVGASVMRNLLAGFSGRVYPVNPHASSSEGITCHATLADIPAEIDLAVIAVPPAAVDEAVDDCIRTGVAGIVVITAGFGETGDEGRRCETALRDKVRRAGLRMIGPNCLGIVTTDPAIRLNTSFAPGMPMAGPVAFASQSGALGLAVLEATERLGVGISSFVSTGNAADVSFADLLEYWEADPRTKVILIYAESFAEPRRFAEVARRVSRTKPIVVLKSGRSPAGTRAASSHTGALAQQDALVDAMLGDAGVLRANTLEELFATAALLAYQPLPHGPRVAVLTNAGGPGILAADACAASGLTMAQPSPATIEALRTFLPANAGLVNPIDMIATASPDDYRRAIPLLLGDPGVDALVAMFIPLSVTNTHDVAMAIADAARASEKPVLTTFFGAPGIASVVAPIPCYTFPETAVRALTAAEAYRRRLSESEAQSTSPRVDRGAVRPVIERAVSTGSGWLDPRATAALLTASGITVVAQELVTNAEQAVVAAARLGYPVVLKGHGPALLHKTDARTVYTDLADESAVLTAYREVVGRQGVEAIVVQAMIRSGVEMLVGAVHQGAFGHAVMCGSGGTLVELLHDVALRLAPLTPSAVAGMLNELRGTRLLRGFRGATPLDEAALAETVLRVSELVRFCPEIVELDLNPVIVTTHGAVVVDARIRLAGREQAAERVGQPGSTGSVMRTTMLRLSGMSIDARP